MEIKATLSTSLTLSMRQLEAGFLGLLASRYLTAASAVILFYDHIITLPDEIELVWASPLSLATTMFYINRYVPVPIMLLGVFHMSPFRTPQSIEFCRLALLAQPIGGAITYIAASWILLLRIIALYRRSRRLAILLYALFLLTHVVALSLVWRTTVQIWPSLKYSSVFGVCMSDNTIRQFSTVYFVLLPFEILLIGLQISHLASHRHVMTMSGAAQPSLLKVIYLDGMVYFVIVFGLRLWAGSIYAFGEVSMFYTAVWTEFAFGATTISRLFLRLRRTARLADGDSGVSLSRSKPFSTGFGISQSPVSIPLSPSADRKRKGRSTSLSTILSVGTLWAKDVIDMGNDDTMEHVNVGPQSPISPSPRPLGSHLLVFIRTRRSSRVRSATF